MLHPVCPSDLEADARVLLLTEREDAAEGGVAEAVRAAGRRRALLAAPRHGAGRVAPERGTQTQIPAQVRTGLCRCVFINTVVRSWRDWTR